MYFQMLLFNLNFTLGTRYFGMVFLKVNFHFCFRNWFIAVFTYGNISFAVHFMQYEVGCTDLPPTAKQTLNVTFSGYQQSDCEQKIKVTTESWLLKYFIMCSDIYNILLNCSINELFFIAWTNDKNKQQGPCFYTNYLSKCSITKEWECRNSQTHRYTSVISNSTYWREGMNFMKYETSEIWQFTGVILKT